MHGTWSRHIVHCLALSLVAVACGDDGGNQSNDDGQVPASCGNGTREGAEVCDGSDLDGVRCTDVAGGFTGGPLACNPLCTGFDTTGCTQAVPCGDGVIDPGETCDGTNLGGADCTTVPGGYDRGTLLCSETCDGFDITGCEVVPPGCGNDLRDLGEECDGEDLAGQTCLDFGYSGGRLYCSRTCNRILLGGCYNGPGTCGNGRVEPFELCDDADLDGWSCEAWGFLGGALQCTDECAFDLTGCLGDYCAEWERYGDGWCDPCEAQGGQRDPDCATVCTESDGTCTSYVSFLVGGSTCLYTMGTEDPDCGTCGDGTRAYNERCEGTDVGYTSCADLGFAGGTLGCDLNCNFETHACILPTCGDGVAEGVEPCDGIDLRSQTCDSIGLGFVGGTLACDPTCEDYDTTGCTLPVCGDGLAQGNEPCDGADLREQTCWSIGAGFTGGTLACAATCDGWATGGCTSVCSADSLGVFAGTTLTRTGDTCAGSSVYSGYAGTCYSALGRELLHELTLPAETSVRLTYDSAVDGVLNVLSTCTDTTGVDCAVSADWNGSSPYSEQALMRNVTNAAVTRWIVVDGRAPDACGTYTLTVESWYIPVDWTCPAEWYNVQDYCDCGCGDWDPDCNLGTLPLYGCPEQGQVCIPPGVCQ